MTTVIDHDSIEAFAGRLTGPVLLPGAAGWEAEIASFNCAHTHTPDLIVGAVSAADVQSAVTYAREHGLPVAVQATGHGASAPIERGLLITTGRMDSLHIDPASRTATVGAGVRWRTVIDAAAPHGLAPLSGSSSDVGVVGYTLGGGLPVMGRMFGYSADRVRWLQVVTPDGRLRDVDAGHEPDLFWALRGGKGNLGIVTALTVELVAVSTVYGGGIFYPQEHIPAVLQGYREWSSSLPDSCATSVAVLRLPPAPQIPEPLRGRTLAHLRVCHVGPVADGERLVAPMRSLAPAVVDTLAEMPYTAVDSIHRDPDHPVPAYERSLLLRELTADTIDALLALIGPHVASPVMLCEIRQLGGALRNPPPVPNAVGGRDAAYSMFVLAVLAPPIAQIAPAAVDEVVRRAAPWSTGQTLLNLHGRPDTEAERARAWDPPAYHRLLGLRRELDPTGLLAFGHVIGA